ncbi:MAG: APC family permease [bacterium]
MNSSPSGPQGTGSLRVKQIVVLATAMLTFIPFWKASAVVLCDFGSSAFYAGGIAMQAFGPAFPWFIMAVMLFSGAMLAVYVESCSMFVRGGVYKVVKEAMGGPMAKVSVSALMFDFLLTGPISGVCAGLYMSGLINEMLELSGVHWAVPGRLFAVIFALMVTAYFWKHNIKGIEESSDKSVKIMSFTSLVGLVLIVWGAYTLFCRGFAWPSFSLEFNEHSLGWAKGVDWLKPIGALGILMAFGHSVLALSGLETLSQVYREMEAPKMRNLKKTAVLVFLFSIVFTGLLTFMSALIVPYESIKTVYADNLLAGLAMNMEGPQFARLILHAFVVMAGGMILSGAVNTSMVGANGVLNRVAEDGVLIDWFRHLHPKYGTTSRIVNLVAGLQAAIILLCMGNVYILGEAYAFGVLWSFVLETLAIIMLRFRETGEREWMVPLNLKIGNRLIPVGLLLILVLLLMTSTVNLITKKTATVFGLCVTAAFCSLFYFSEKINKKKARLIEESGSDEKLNLRYENEIISALDEISKPNRVLVAVRNPSNMHHLGSVLGTVNGEDTDIIVIHSKIAKGIQLEGETVSMGPEETRLFSTVVSTAEKYGQTVVPMLLLSNDPFYAIAQVARIAKVHQIVLGVSGSMGAELQLERLAMAWGAIGGSQDPGRPVAARVIWESREMSFQLS